MKHSSGGKTEFLLPIFSEECAQLIPPFVFVFVWEMHVCVWSRKNDTRAELVETSTSQEGVKFGELTHYRKNISLFRKYFRKSRACVNPLDTRRAASFFPPLQDVGEMPSLFCQWRRITKGKNPPVTHMMIFLGKKSDKSSSSRLALCSKKMLLKLH